MIMVAVRITVGCYHHLKAISPKLLRQRNTQIMGLLGRDLSGPEGLDSVVADPSAQLAPILLCRHKLLRCKFGIAVDAGHIGQLLGFHFVHCVLQHIVDGVQHSGSLPVNGLFRIHHILYQGVHPSPDGPNRCYRHYAALLK